MCKVKHRGSFSFLPIVIQTQVGVNYIKLLSQFLLVRLTSDLYSNLSLWKKEPTMTKLLANPKLFAAAGLLFAVASFYNFSSNSTAYAGSSVVAPPSEHRGAVTADLFPAPQCCNLTSRR
jgi:hypothetical protein